MFLSVIIFVSCIKVLFIPSYKSTDFEVHRNWLAITHSLPINKWYFDETSEWTLDYPPFFAWFEYFLSLIAQYVDAAMLDVQNINYSSWKCVLFQRCSVILSDLVYALGIHRCKLTFEKDLRSRLIVPTLLFANIGLLMVDHIHFQYNGMLFGILLISTSEIAKNNYLRGAFWFVFLLHMKHIFMYVAPVYFIYLLRNYCFKSEMKKSFPTTFLLGNFLKLSFVVIGVTVVAFLPFYNHIGQVVSRMFPFKRGLCHAYWAPNMWALYNTADKILSMMALKLNVNLEILKASMTGGLVQEFSHAILPDITPFVTIILTLVFMIPILIKLWSNRGVMNFIRGLVLCAMTSFLFGWHVHEKAILMVIIPLSILAVQGSEDAKIYLITSSAGHYSLFPLLFPSFMLPVKVMLYFLFTSYSFYSLSNLYPRQFSKFSLPLLSKMESVYLFGFIPLSIYDNFFHELFGLNMRYPFLPLMLTSVYCSVGLIYSWLRYYAYFLTKCM